MSTRLPTILALLLALSISVLSASILPTSASSTFPQCGLTCAVLTSAQTSCESGDAASWTSCFCQSALLTGLKTSGSICSSCSSGDQTLLSTWYNSYCSSGGTTTAAAATTTSSAAAGATSTTASKSTTSNSTTDTENKSWWSTHYRWVVMLIVLLIGFSLIGAFGVWLKRRYDAKRPNLYHGGSSGALSTASPPGPRDAAWGPAPVAANSARSLPSGSVASSRSNIAKSSTPVPGTRTRLTKIEQIPGDVETRQV